MHRIRICFLDTEFEHDIFELIRAFYPEAAFDIRYGRGEETADEESPELSFTVFRTEDDYCIEQTEGERSLIRVPVVEGQSGDGREALLSCDAEERIRRHAARKEQKDSLKTELYQLLVEKKRAYTSLGRSYRDPACQAGDGDAGRRHGKPRGCRVHAGKV